MVMAKKKGRLEFMKLKKNEEKVAWITAYDGTGVEDSFGRSFSVALP